MKYVNFINCCNISSVQNKKKTQSGISFWSESDEGNIRSIRYQQVVYSSMKYCP